jgi:hypothetical protein
MPAVVVGYRILTRGKVEGHQYRLRSAALCNVRVEVAPPVHL